MLTTKAILSWIIIRLNVCAIYILNLCMCPLAEDLGGIFCFLFSLLYAYYGNSSFSFIVMLNPYLPSPIHPSFSWFLCTLLAKSRWNWMCIEQTVPLDCVSEKKKKGILVFIRLQINVCCCFLL